MDGFPLIKLSKDVLRSVPVSSGANDLGPGTFFARKDPVSALAPDASTQ